MYLGRLRRAGSALRHGAGAHRKASAVMAHAPTARHLARRSGATCAAAAASIHGGGRWAKACRRLLLAGPGTAAALLWAAAAPRQGAAACGGAAAALAPGAAGAEVVPVAAVGAARRSPALRRARDYWWRVFWRCLMLMLRAAPVVCLAPFCWLWWSRGGEERFWRALLSALQAHGPIAVKFAQWASTRPDLLPVSVCDHFAQLQADVRPHAFRETARTLGEAFGPGWAEELQLEGAPVGSGCMAQVYRGRLLCPPGYPGQEVAVKVRHPGAQEQVDLDLDVMWLCVSTLEAVWPSARYLALSEFVGHFEDFVRPQADLRLEASNLEAFRQNFEYSKTGKGLRVCFPEVIRPYVTESVLVESYEHATPLQAVLGQRGPATTASTASSRGGDAAAGSSEGGPPATEVRERVGKLCMDAFLKMVFVDNFIHGDLHPGNISFRFPDAAPASGGARRDLGEPELVLMDAGLAVRLSPRNRRDFMELFHAIAMNDGSQAGRLIVERSPGDPSVVVDRAGFVAGVARLVGEVRGHGLSLGSIRLGEVFGEMLGLALAHRVKLETSFVKVATSIIVLEGVGRQLNPVVDLILAAKPLLVEALAQRFW